MSIRRSSFCMLSVALRKESVDRNITGLCHGLAPRLSLSARRAWIEIYRDGATSGCAGWSLSARRAWIEISSKMPGFCIQSPSLSARRAWIEIPVILRQCAGRGVALRKESVDRNWQRATAATWARRSLSARRAWIEISKNHNHARKRRSRSPQGERG